MIACPLSLLNAHETERKAPYEPHAVQAALRALLPHIAPLCGLVDWVHGDATPDMQFAHALGEEIMGRGVLSVKMLYQEYTPLNNTHACDTKGSVPIVGGIDSEFARKLSCQEVADTATLLVLFKSRHPAQDSKTSVSIRIKRIGWEGVSLEIRPVKGRWVQKMAKTLGCGNMLDTMFDLSATRTPYLTGYAQLTRLFRTVEEWSLRKHVVVKPMLTWSVVPYHIAKLLAAYMNKHMRLHVLGAATNTGTPIRDLTFSRVAYTTTCGGDCLAKLSAILHPGNGLCWCGIHPRCGECATASDTDTKSVRIDIQCCGRIPFRNKITGSYKCGAHPMTTTQCYHTPNQEAALCTEGLSVTIHCIHERELSIEELAAKQYESYVPDYCLPVEERTKWTETCISIIPDENERHLLGALLNASIRTHNMLVAYHNKYIDVKDGDQVQSTSETAGQLRRDMKHEAFFLKASLAQTHTVTNGAEHSDEVCELGEEKMKMFDEQVCELLRERKLWTSIPKSTLWAAGNVKKRRYRTREEAARLGRSASVLARAVVSKNASMRQFSSTKSGLGGSTPAKLPPLYRRLAPVQIQTDKKSE
mgnify:CR=1 FL=1